MPLTAMNYLENASSLLKSRDKALGILPFSEKKDKNFFSVSDTSVYCDLDANFLARIKKIKQRMSMCDPKIQKYVDKTLEEMKPQIDSMRTAAKEYRLLSFAKNLAEQTKNDPDSEKVAEELENRMKMYHGNLVNPAGYTRRSELAKANLEEEKKLPQDMQEKRKALRELSTVLSGLENVTFIITQEHGYYYGKTNPDGTVTVAEKEEVENLPEEEKKLYSDDFVGNLDIKVAEKLKAMGKLPPKEIVALAGKVHLPKTAEVQFNSFTRNYMSYEANKTDNMTIEGEELLGVLTNSVRTEDEAYLEYGNKNFERYATESVFNTVEPLLYHLDAFHQFSRVLIGGRPYQDIYDKTDGDPYNIYAMQKRRSKREVARLQKLHEMDQTKSAAEKADEMNDAQNHIGVTDVDTKVSMCTAIAAALKEGIPVTILPVDMNMNEMPPVKLTAKGLDKPVPKPEINWWKKLAHKCFGWLGAYNEEFAQLDKYNAQQKMKSDEEVARGKFYEKNIISVADEAKKWKDSAEMQGHLGFFENIKKEVEAGTANYSDEDYRNIAKRVDTFMNDRKKLQEPTQKIQHSATMHKP